MPVFTSEFEADEIERHIEEIKRQKEKLESAQLEESTEELTKKLHIF